MTRIGEGVAASVFPVEYLQHAFGCAHLMTHAQPSSRSTPQCLAYRAPKEHTINSLIRFLAERTDFANFIWNSVLGLNLSLGKKP